MSRTLFLAMMGVVFCYSPSRAQSQDPPKYEAAIEFTTLLREGSGDGAVGVGPRFTFNLNKNVALETAVYFFPDNCFQCFERGRMTEIVGGVKVGKRFEKWGLFAKARPGVVTYSRGNAILRQANPGQLPPDFFVDVSRLTNFAADLGGVLEFYPTERIVTRFDAGDTIIHFNRQRQNFLAIDPTTYQITLVPFTVGARTTNNFQFSASVGFRF
jgi:hypothetical protein